MESVPAFLVQRTLPRRSSTWYAVGIRSSSTLVGNCSWLLDSCTTVLVMATSPPTSTSPPTTSSGEFKTSKRKPSPSAESHEESRRKKQQRSLEPLRLNYGRDGSNSTWKNYMDLMQPLDPFWGLFSRSDTMDCVQVNPVSWKGQRACDWCVQAKGGGQRC